MQPFTRRGVWIVALGLIALLGCADTSPHASKNQTTAQQQRLEDRVEALRQENQQLQKENEKLQEKLRREKEAPPSWDELRQDLRQLLDQEANATRDKTNKWLENFQDQLDSWQEKLTPSNPEEEGELL